MSVAKVIEISSSSTKSFEDAILTGVTAGVGLGMNCAMIFEPDPHDPDVLVGRAAVGPHDRAEADRVWRAIEAEQPSLVLANRAFHRLLVAQAMIEDLSIVSVDRVFAAYGVDVVW